MSTSTAEDVEAIWEEVICDSLADMNVFSGSKQWAEAAEHMGMTIPAVQKAVSEGKANQTRGSPEAEGKASRQLHSKHDKALYASGVSFLHKNFPPENERLSEAHRLAVWWARNPNIEAGDQTLIFMNNTCYLVECFDDALNNYQVEDVVSKADYEYYYKEITKNGKVGKVKSILAAPAGYDSNNRQYNSLNQRKPSVDSNEAQYRGENSKMVRLDREQIARGKQFERNGRGDSQSGGKNIQKYSRELDTDYLDAVKSGDMETAQKMVDEAAKILARTRTHAVRPYGFVQAGRRGRRPLRVCA